MMDNMIDPSRPEEREGHTDTCSAIQEADAGYSVDLETMRTTPEIREDTDTLQRLVNAEDLPGTTLLLASNLESLAHGDFEWLLEVRDMGYSHQQIAEALIIEKSQTPWICFSPRSLSSLIQAEFHRIDCAHSWAMARDRLNTDEMPRGTVLVYDYMRIESADIRRIVSEMCGLGGVVPSIGEKSDWNGQVNFQAANSIAEISYESTQHSESLRIAEELRRAQNAVDVLSAACGWLQEQDLCCNSFTILVQTQADEVVETVSVPMRLIDRFRTELPALQGKTHIDEHTMHIADTSHEILTLFCPGDLLEILLQKTIGKGPTGSYPDILDVLDCCALSAQALNLALLSYSNAHVGHVHPFFLKGPVTEIRLLGSGRTLSHLANLSLRLVTLTSMGDMLRDVVCVFETRRAPGNPSCHLLASPHDILDTWGPGQFIFGKPLGDSASPYSLCAIEVSGGIIRRPHSDSDLLRWNRRHSETSPLLPISLNVHGKVLIGA